MNALFRGMTFVVLIAITLGCKPENQLEMPRNPAPPPDEPQEIEESTHETATFPLTEGTTTETD